MNNKDMAHRLRNPHDLTLGEIFTLMFEAANRIEDQERKRKGQKDHICKCEGEAVTKSCMLNKEGICGKNKE